MKRGTIYNIGIAIFMAFLMSFTGPLFAAQSEFITITVKVDGIPPEVTDVFPEDNHVFDSSPIIVHGTVTDAAGIDRVRITVKVREGGEVIIYDTVLATIDGTHFEGTVNIREGHNNLHIWAFDAVENGTHVYRAITLDTTPPGFEITFPPDGSYINKDGNAF